MPNGRLRGRHSFHVAMAALAGYLRANVRCVAKLHMRRLGEAVDAYPGRRSPRGGILSQDLHARAVGGYLFVTQHALVDGRQRRGGLRIRRTVAVETGEPLGNMQFVRELNRLLLRKRRGDSEQDKYEN